MMLEGVWDILSFRSIICINWYRFHIWGLNYPYCLCLQPCRYWWHMLFTFPRMVYQCLEEMPSGFWNCEYPGLILWSDQIRGAPACFPSTKLHCRNFNHKLWCYIHPGKSDQQKSPDDIDKPECSVFLLNILCKMELGGDCLIFHISCNPPRPWRILIRYGWIPS